ncbi:hypothetical protein CO608_11160 [Lysobacteraceae bacterium NML08-0793]|nr:hypothetical protein CO608_11160 [Xanthomonadaceae bacterium NML08-0793]
MTRLLLPLLLLLGCAADASAERQGQTIRRCIAADGSLILTDKPCESIGATERVPRPLPQAPVRAPGIVHRPGTPPPLRDSCIRNLEELRGEVAAAIELKDANRLGGVYHWPGQSSRSSEAILQRLETIAQRRLIDVIAVGGGQSEPQWVENADGELVLIPGKRRAPTGLRVLQSTGSGSTSVTFGLRRHMGCLWISL